MKGTGITGAGSTKLPVILISVMQRRLRKSCSSAETRLSVDNRSDVKG